MKRRELCLIMSLVVLVLAGGAWGAEFLLTNGDKVSGELIEYDGQTYRVRSALGILSIPADKLAVIRFNTQEGVVDIVLGTATPQRRDRIQGKVESFRQGELRIATDG